VSKPKQYSFEESASHRPSRQVTQLFTYLLTHKLFSSWIWRYLVTCRRLSDAIVICRVTYFQFPILSAFLRIDPVSLYFIGWPGRDLAM